jgi:Fe-S cluster biogenesis protein NfuA
MTDDTEFQSRMQQLNELLQEMDSIKDPSAREKTGQILQGVMDFHGAALASLLGCLSQAGEAGQAIVAGIAADDLAASLLLLYGLHPDDLPTRVNSALEKARPYLASHGGNVELLGISDDGVVRLAMQGSCHGCPSSAATLKSTIEQAIYELAPEVESIQIQDEHPVEPGTPAGFVSVDSLLANVARHPVIQGAPV